MARKWSSWQKRVAVIIGGAVSIASFGSIYAVGDETYAYRHGKDAICRGYDAGDPSEPAVAEAHPPQTKTQDEKLGGDNPGHPGVTSNSDVENLNIACESKGIARAGLELQFETFFATMMIGAIAGIGAVAAAFSLDGPADPAGAGGCDRASCACCACCARCGCCGCCVGCGCQGRSGAHRWMVRGGTNQDGSAQAKCNEGDDRETLRHGGMPSFSNGMSAGHGQARQGLALFGLAVIAGLVVGSRAAKGERPGASPDL